MGMAPGRAGPSCEGLSQRLGQRPPAADRTPLTQMVDRSGTGSTGTGTLAEAAPDTAAEAAADTVADASASRRTRRISSFRSSSAWRSRWMVSMSWISSIRGTSLAGRSARPLSTTEPYRRYMTVTVR